MSTAQVKISPQQLLQAVGQLRKSEFDAFFLQILSLQFQRKQQNQYSKPEKFLQAITGLGHSQETTVSTHVKDILQKEIDPVRGWSLK